VRIRFQDQTKSSAVTGSPLDHFPFLLRLKIYSFPSSLILHDSAAPDRLAPPFGFAVVRPSHIVTGVPEHHILISLCEGLTTANPNGGANLSGAAESWSISDDGKEYIFNLNKNGKWSNGDPVTAEDFVWSWKRILTASLGSQYPDMLYYLEGASDYHNGITDDFDTVGVKAIDEYTLKVNLISPTPFFWGY
jgi:ABC-type oligopeptide transport system substrate-binding subunit